MIANAQIRFNEFTPVVPNSSSGSSSSYTPPIQNNNNWLGKSRIKFNEFHPVVPEKPGTTYNAIVIYESSTGHENTYELPVIVNNGVVKKICFNNGGSVHAGTNNSGYTYYGGKLQYVKDLDTYATVVTVVYSNSSWQKFTIVLE